MGIVVLIGFSCAGKSSLLEPLRNYISEKGLKLPLEFDTDAKITEQDYPDGGIYSVFLDKSIGKDTDPAMQYIIRREHEVLRELLDIQGPAIIAAGPLILQRKPDWSNFLAKHKPTVVWLQLNPKRTVEGLKHREGRYRTMPYNGKPAEEHPSFGCWNQDILNKYDEATQTWQPMAEEAQVAAATNYMKHFAETYYKKVDRVEVVDMNQIKPGNDYQKRLLEKLTAALYS